MDCESAINIFYTMLCTMLTYLDTYYVEYVFPTYFEFFY